MEETIQNNRRNLALELAIVTVACMAVARVLFALRGNSFVSPILSVIVAILFLYVPIAVLWLRKRSVDFLDTNWRGYLKSILTFVVVAVIVFVPFFFVARAWQSVVYGMKWQHFAGYPNFLGAISFQLLLVALPEEFFFRGYFQSTIDRIFERRWNIFGAKLGWGWLITAFVFAFAHSVVFYKWWHFSIFFPALLFGYLRARTGSITAPVLFHALSNLFVEWFVRCYV